MYFKGSSSIILFLLISNFMTGFCEDNTPCFSRLTCGACLSSHNCAWCSEETYKRDAQRCDEMGNLLQQGCSEKNIVNPSSKVEILGKSLSDAEVFASTVLLKPQKLKLTLRAGEPANFILTYRNDKNYPVDLYYLMDLTFTMKKHKGMLAKLSHDIANNMKDQTKNFRLGFGSFIDKNVMPYVDMVPERLHNPCREELCSPPYGFRNHLPLNENITFFTQVVSAANVSGNLDDAEGGFDAIIQVIACKEKIGWNDRSRKIILFATNGNFHSAGDGKLGGIIKPNDGNCHLDDEGYYTESMHQDYPSLSQLNSKIIENNVQIIFAVPDSKLTLYQRLSEQLEGTYVEKLENDGFIITNLIYQQYDKIQSKVELKDDSPDYLKVTYSSNCLGQKFEEVNFCEGLEVGTVVTFNVKVELLKCPNNSKHWRNKINIYPVGLNEAIELDIDLICECDCEKVENVQEKSPECSYRGTYKCGICNCDPNYFGRKCECQENNVYEESKISFCKMNGSDVCSGRGDCVCGVCDCYGSSSDLIVYGEYCECDTFSCDRDSNGQVCGGEDRGSCCGKCICKNGWTGPACDCKASKDTCIAPVDIETGRLCCGKGECLCGECQCYKNEEYGSFGGPFCCDQSFPTLEGQCTELKNCVECQTFNSGYLTEDECSNCLVILEVVDEIGEIHHNENKCIFKDEEGCIFIFVYSYDNNNKPVIRVLKMRDCPEKQTVLWIVLGVVAGIFFIGLICVLIVKCLVLCRDRRNKAEFEAEIAKCKLPDEFNPLYAEAISEYHPPDFRKSKKLYI